ncbi:ribosomal protein L7Ae [Cavenderia fasciculata]|uniref:H/ACA ribonucleoprotein complex subunit 2 n=1 Tax=Cavenderia fasciculata TaxID=261658 RepID=F4QF29_CACFS|nr:ribosomal protein L7Ae [Cavenderia fasciculata]EGG13388.1 ribosomal protein L7Ae [Cavenderia fasciculata]|eukprot:XP_004350092.1 ribosomal protein L7Ae [Cavenderia fasciculata]
MSDDEKTIAKPAFVSPIAQPMADTKLTDKLLKLVKKASKDKKLRRGVKEVVKTVRKSPKETKSNKNKICIIAGDVSPIDVLSHIPVMCEERNIKYIYVPSKEALGVAGSTKRPTSIAMVELDDDSEHKSLMKECLEKIPVSVCQDKYR